MSEFDKQLDTIQANFDAGILSADDANQVLKESIRTRIIAGEDLTTHAPRIAEMKRRWSAILAPHAGAAPAEPAMLISDVLASIDGIGKADPPELFANQDQVAERFVGIENRLKTSSLSPAEKVLAERKMLKAKADLYCRALLRRVVQLEGDNKGWSYFDNSEGAIWGVAVFNKLYNLQEAARERSWIDEEQYIKLQRDNLTLAFGLIKGAYGYWLKAGQALLGNKADDGGVSRQFPNLTDAEQEMEMEGPQLKTLITKNIVVSGEVINTKIERRVRTLTPDLIRRFELNGSFEDGDDFLDRDIELKNGDRITLENETTNAWLMRMFDKLMRHDYKATDPPSPFIDPASGKRIDSFEICGANVLDAIAYVYRKAQAYGLPISESQARRAFRTWSVVTINQVALAPHPTGISDKVYQTFWWTSYLSKEWLYGNLAGTVEPFLSLSLIGDRKDNHPLDVFTTSGVQDSILPDLVYKLAIKRVVDGGGLLAVGNKGLGTRVMTEDVVWPSGDREQVNRLVGPSAGYSVDPKRNQKHVAAFFNLPLLDSDSIVWDIEPPLEYFAELGGPNKGRRFTYFQDTKGNYIYEQMPWENASVQNYYRDLTNKALGFVKNFFHSDWASFASKVESKDLTELFKNIQYTLQFIPKIGHDIRFGTQDYALKVRKQAGGGNIAEYEMKLNSGEIEDLFRFLVLVQYILIKMLYQDQTKWNRIKTQEWLRTFFRSHENYFVRSNLFGTDNETRNETARKYLLEIVDAMEPTVKKGINLVQRGVIHAAEGARRSTV